MVYCGMGNCLIPRYSYPISQFLDNVVWSPTEEEGEGCVCLCVWQDTWKPE